LDKDLHLDRFTPNLDYHVCLKKILGLQIERGEAELLEDANESIRVLATDGDEYIQVARIAGKTVYAHRVTPNYHELNLVAFE
jgi:hypothetical protein